MMIRSGFSSLARVVFLVVFGGTVSGLRSQDAGTWQAERARLARTVDERVRKMADQVVDREKVAQRLAIPWPVTPPTQRKEQIVAKIEAQVEKEAKAKFPDAKRKEFLKEAQELYRVYKAGELVPEFRLARNYGPGVIVQEGHLIQVTQQFVRVGTRWLKPMDLTDEMKARFYEEHSERMIKIYVRKKEVEYNRMIDAFKKEHMERRLPLAFMNDHYCPKKPIYARSTDPSKWWSQQDAVEEWYKLVHSRAANELRGKIETEVFQANGYVKVAEKNNEWMPRAEAEAFRQRARDEAASKGGIDMFEGGGGGMGGPGAGASGEAGVEGGQCHRLRLGGTKAASPFSPSRRTRTSAF